MSEYFEEEPREIKPGEPITFMNKCKSPFRVGTGIMFESDGEYHVIVNGNYVSVQEYYPELERLTQLAKEGDNG